MHIVTQLCGSMKENKIICEPIGYIIFYLYVYFVIKPQNDMRLTVREIRRWMFEEEFLTLVVGETTMDNSTGRRYLYDMDDQEMEVNVIQMGNRLYVEL
jgi:hypothetical protein